MPKLWRDTMDTHRQAVRDATLDVTAALVSEHGLAAVTMSRIAQDTGIGRATLYKYFPDVETILLAWHERQVARHLKQLTRSCEQAESAFAALQNVLHEYAGIVSHNHGGTAAMLHRSPHALESHAKLLRLVRDVVDRAIAERALRADVPADELARFCLAALSAAEGLHEHRGADRLVELVLAAMMPAGRG